ncbi:META domain-containing protein [Streptomyces sp. NBC_00184]|uniref:META domain-containing protein n=1 Tax=Streptomyces sp. NBC_00184 TaxID=2975673 RepID=UPI002E297884|nr:META domain-containing protein [Streptomyces sp. NBC_00184]
MAMHRQSLAVSLLALLALAACGTESGAGSGQGSGSGHGAGSDASDGSYGGGGSDGSGTVRSGAPLTGIRWDVESVTAGGKRSVAPAGAHVEFDAKGRASGSYGCNLFTAEARLDGDTLTVEPGTTTEMGCEPDIQQFEALLSQAFSGKLTVAAKDAGITLTTAEGGTIALTARPPAPLTGTRWRITTLVSGSIASSLPAGTANKAHITLGKDGTVQGVLGCNRFRGTADVSGTAIAFGRLVTTRRMCPDPETRLERALLDVLDGKRTAYGITHHTLSLTAPDGKGLAASAPETKEEGSEG